MIDWEAVDQYMAVNRRIREGLELQRDRLLQRKSAIREHLDEYILGPSNDLDYYIYELARLQDLARTIAREFHAAQPVAVALKTFDVAIPHLRKLRNPLTHPSNDKRLDNIKYLVSAEHVEDFKHRGTVYLDPDSEHHEAALALSEAMDTYLGGWLAQNEAQP